MLERKLAEIYIPPVLNPNDDKAFMQLFEIHVYKKMLFRDLMTGEATHEEVLEALETFIGTGNMDGYIAEVKPKLDLILPHGY